MTTEGRKPISTRRRRAAWAGVAAGLAAGMLMTRCGRRRYDLRGRVVLITGGSRGLGMALAREFGRRGARLVIAARTLDELARAEATLRDEGLDVHAVQCDIRDATQAARAVEVAVQVTGRLDVLVNNAGVIQVTPLANATPEDYADSLQTHFWGPLALVRASVPHLRRAPGGARILNVSSIGGRLSVPHLTPYAVGKFALTAYSEGLRAELQRDGILVTTATPSLVRTGSHLRARIRGQHEAEARWFGLGMTNPLTSLSAPRAAARLVEATVIGRAHIAPDARARLGEIVHVLAPELTAAVMALVTRYALPAPSAAASAGILREAQDVGFGWVEPFLPHDAAVAHNQTDVRTPAPD